MSGSWSIWSNRGFILPEFLDVFLRGLHQSAVMFLLDGFDAPGKRNEICILCGIRFPVLLDHIPGICI